MVASVNKKSNAHEIIETILSYIFQGQTRRHQLCVDKICREHNVSGVFMHKGQTFRASWAQTGLRRTALPEAAWPDMDRFLLDKDAVDWDSKAFWQTLFSMVSTCISLQEVRDALPDFVAELIPGLAELPRIDEEAWTIKDQSRLMRQYQKLRPKMELYVNLINNPQLAKLMSLYHFSED